MAAIADAAQQDIQGEYDACAGARASKPESPTPNTSNLQTVYPYPGKSKSSVWDVFGFYKKKTGPPVKENLDMTFAVCRLCHKKYSNKGNTTNFSNHINSAHGNLGTEATKEQATKPQLITSFLNRPVLGKITPQRQQEIDDALCKFIAGKVVPVSVVDNSHFLALMDLLDPRYKVPSRPTVMKMLQKKKDEIELSLRAEIKMASSVAITHDGWTSLNTQSFFTTTLHYIDDKWHLRSAVLGTVQLKGTHTAENISEELGNFCQHWKLPGTPIATTDNAANEVKALSMLEWERFGCFGHRINLVVKNSLDVPEVGRLLGKARKMITHFHHSSSISDLLYEKQKMVFDTPETQRLVGHKLITDVPTRWNSTLYMLQRLCEQFPVLMSLANDPSLSKVASSTLKNCVFSFEEQSLAESITGLLEPFETATKIVSADKVPTIQKVLPTVLKLNSLVKEDEDDHPTIKKIKERMNDELDKRTASSKISVLGCLLNPFTKNLDFQPELRETAERYLKNELEKLCEESESEISENMHQMENDDQGPQPKKLKSADTDDWLADIVCTTRSPAVQLQVSVENEIQRYLDESLIKADENLTVLQWWEANQRSYPRLRLLAKKYLCVPASSVPSERIFSLCGQIVTKKRCRISPKNIDLLVFLNKNIDRWN